MGPPAFSADETRRWRLLPELVPRPLWGVSAYRILSRTRWNKIRALVLYQAANTCFVCAKVQDKGMVCHEVWNCDDSQHIAQLVRLAILCPDCNFVHHLGRAGQIGVQDRAVAHMIAVNGMSKADASVVVRTAFEEWEERSQHRWRIAVDDGLVARFPDFAMLIGLGGRSPIAAAPTTA